MSNSSFVVVVTSADNANGVLAKIGHGGAGQGTVGKTAAYLQTLGAGIIDSSISILTSAVAATGTVTFSGISNNDTVTINGRIYTAKTSGASGLNQFNIGGSDAQAAINLAAAINADTSALISGVVTATAASGVVTLTCVTPGVLGNLVTIAISAHGSVSGGGLLASGAQDAAFSTIRHGI